MRDQLPDVISAEQARARGMSPGRLRAAGYERAHRGVYVDGHVGASLATRAAAALLTSPPGSYISHNTAAQLLGYWVPATAAVHVTVPSSARRRSVDGVIRHRPPMNPQARRVAGVPVSIPAQCVAELSRVLTLVDLVVLLDSVCQRERLSVDDLRELIGGSPRGRLGRALPLVSAHAESAQETRVRLLLALSGLPAPVVQHGVRDPETGCSYRLDLAYPEYMLAIEYDGRQHASDQRQYARDVQRRNALQRLGWTVITVVAQPLFNAPGQVLDEVASAIEARTGRRPVIDPRWRGHFTQR